MGFQDILQEILQLQEGSASKRKYTISTYIVFQQFVNIPIGLYF
jgi:hypothetical protein